jgi:hypothetical protein
MIDLQEKLLQFEALAHDCEQIAKGATDLRKRDLFLRVGGHYRELAKDIKAFVDRAPSVRN